MKLKEFNYEMKRKEKKMRNEEDINEMIKWNKEDKMKKEKWMILKELNYK